MTLVLRISQHEGLPVGQTAEKHLEHGRLVLGRGAESDWVLADPGRTISKRHCVIEQAELGYELTDLSINGVFLKMRTSRSVSATRADAPRRSDSYR